MRAGTLRDRVRIDYPTRVQSGTGEVSYTWAELCSPRAEVLPMAGEIREQFAHQIAGRQAFTIRIRYLKGVRTNQRVYWLADCADQYLDIVNIRFDRKRTMHMLDCALNEADQ